MATAPEGLVRDSQRRVLFMMRIVAVVFAFYHLLYRTVWSEFRTDFGHGSSL